MRLAIAALFAALTACASVQSAPAIVGGVTYVRLTIANNRSKDTPGPSFYLEGSGRHSLGSVAGLSQPQTRWVDTRWLGADGCMTISAHYPGTGDLVFERFCWKPGERIEVTLEEHFNRVAAWSHR